MKRFEVVRHLVVATLEIRYDDINMALQKAGMLSSASFSVPPISQRRPSSAPLISWQQCRTHSVTGLLGKYVERFFYLPA
jgi:hypothetical protein